MRSFEEICNSIFSEGIQHYDQLEMSTKRELTGAYLKENRSGPYDYLESLVESEHCYDLNSMLNGLLGGKFTPADFGRMALDMTIDYYQESIEDKMAELHSEYRFENEEFLRDYNRYGFNIGDERCMTL